MRQPILLALIVLALWLPTAAPRTQDPAPDSVRLEPVTLRDATGKEIRADRGRLFVPENRRRADARTIEVAFARLRSTAEQPGPPLIYLHGGPGDFATGAVRDPQALAQWARFLELGDVILLDQRGGGASRPLLGRRLSAPPPPDSLASRDAFEQYLAKGSEEVKAQLAAEGIDISGYDTEQIADDVDALRAGLGAETMRLLGFSYGTHLGLSVIRRHGARVDAAVLVGVEGPDETDKLPSSYDTHLHRLAAMVARDPLVGESVPDLVGLLRRVLGKLEQEPIRVNARQPGTGVGVEVVIGRYALEYILVRDLGDTSDLPVIPRLLWTLDQGDSSVLRWFVQKRYGQSGFLPTQLFTIDTASGCSPERAARIEREAATAILRNSMNFRFPAAAAVWQMPELGEAFRAPIVSSVRTLFLTGDLDANTPPYQAERVRWGFCDSVHLVQRHGGHEDWMRNPKVLPVLYDFFAGKDVSRRDVDMPTLRFIPVQGAVPAGLSHPAIGA